MGQSATTQVTGTMTSAGRRMPVKVTESNIDDFLREFDTIISDCDGVIWTPLKMFPKAKDGLKSLRAAGKKIYFATNNSVAPTYSKFERFGFPMEKDEVVHPALAIARYLEKIGFKKKAYVLATDHFKDHLREKGVEVLPKHRGGVVDEDLADALRNIKEDPDVGAVIVDVDLNVNYSEILQAANHLRSNPDCHFFAGATDNFAQMLGKTLLGPLFVVRTLEEASGRKALICGKPGSMMIEHFLKEVHNLNVQRTIFVGDTLVQDMGVANACGMKKLLVLSGMTSLEDLYTCALELLPDYYINAIEDFANLIKKPKA